jgi:hypothetical protein
MELVRRFIRETPSGVGIILTGRVHFFNNEKEMWNAFGSPPYFVRLSLSEFTEEQVRVYLNKLGLHWQDALPSWLPTRPLLLGYLATRGLLQQTLNVAAGSSPAVGWHQLLNRISAREAEGEYGIDAGTVRRLLERVATLARSSADGLGPITSEQLQNAFRQVCGYDPDDRGMVLLQRLPSP